jgi:hypothetical protein
VELKEYQESPMVPEVKAKWIEALRSDKYRQTGGVLHTQDSVGVSKFCCLGVLSEIAYQEGVIQRERQPEGSEYRYGTGEKWDVAFLPHAVCEWAGIENRAGQYGPESFQALVDHNDNGDSFLDIANVIEAHF